LFFHNKTLGLVKIIVNQIVNRRGESKSRGYKTAFRSQYFSGNPWKTFRPSVKY